MGTSAENIGGFQLLETLGMGSSCAVYRARNNKGEIRAVRIFKAPREAPTFARSVLDLESEAVSFRHAHGAQMFSFGLQQGEIYAVEEFLQGITLETAMRRAAEGGKSLPISVVLAVGVQVARVLAVMHETATAGPERRLFHGSISPHAIMLTSLGEVKVVGCGLGRARKLRRQSSLSRLAYMAPEALSGDHAGPRADIYSLGVVIRDALLGERAFLKGTLAETERAILDSAATQLPEHAPSGALTELLVQTMARFPEARPETADAVEAVLLSMAASDPEVWRRDIRELVGVRAEGGEATESGATDDLNTPDIARELPKAPSNDSSFGAATEPMPRLTPAKLEAEDLLVLERERERKAKMSIYPAPAPKSEGRAKAKPRAVSAASLEKPVGTSGNATIAGRSTTSSLKNALQGWELGPEIARTGPIATYEGKEVATGKAVMVRVFDETNVHEAKLDRSGWLSRWETEVSAAARFSHPSLPKLIEATERGKIRYAVYDIGEGMPLNVALARKSPVEQTTLRAMMANVADSIHQLHDEGFIFCNVQANALWLTPQGEVRPWDLSMIAPIGGALHPLLGENVMALSPEFLASKAYTPASDQFALGALLYELLTQTRPFRGLDTTRIANAIKDKEPIAPHTIDSRTDKKLSEAAMRALAKDPSARFPTLADLAKDLGAIPE